jgi:hypothetical protein
MLARHLVAGSDAPRAQIEPDGRAFDNERCWLDVGKPGPAGMLLRVAYPVSEPQSLSAHITFNGQF